MNRHAISTTAAALLAAFLAVPAAAAPPEPASSGPVSRCDRPMADAETMGANVAACFDVVAASRAAISLYAGQREALAKILASSKPEPLKPGVSLSTGGPLGAAERALGLEVKTETAPAAWPEDPAFRGLARLPVLEQLRNYHLYTAFATNDPSFCDRLKYVKKDRVCRQDLADLQFWRDRLGSDQAFEKACRQTEYTETRLQDKAAQAKTNACCAQVAAARASASPDCSSMVPNCFPDQGTCRAFFGSLRGDAASCDAIKLAPGQGCESQAACKAMGTGTPCDGSPETFAARCAQLLEDDRENCRATARFAGAWRAKDASQCKGDERCRVLMGEGKKVAAEIAAEHLQTPGTQWFLNEGWKKPVVTSTKLARDPKKQVVPQAPPAKTPPTQPAQPTVQGLPSEAQRKALDFKGFVCQEPIGSVENRKAIAATMNAAHVCLADIDSALATPSTETSEAIDAREERLARLNYKMAGLFGDVKAAAPATKAPARRPAPAKPAQP